MSAFDNSCTDRVSEGINCFFDDILWGNESGVPHITWFPECTLPFQFSVHAFSEECIEILVKPIDIDALVCHDEVVVICHDNEVMDQDRIAFSEGSEEETENMAGFAVWFEEEMAINGSSGEEVDRIWDNRVW